MPQVLHKTRLAPAGAVTDFEALRADFPIFADGPTVLHYLDSAASAQKPACVIDAISNCYRHEYGPIHRGLYPLAELASERYESARQTVANFINAGKADEIVFTRSATEAINLVANGWGGTQLEPGNEIWVSQMEHHSNLLPWQRICAQRGASLRIIPVDDQGRLDLENAQGVFGEKSRLIAITQVSNVLGTINPIKELVDRASLHSIPVLVDAAQSVGHMPVDVQDLGCDFLVASAHKMCGPTGIGFLYGKIDRLDETEPLLLGGGMVDEVGVNHSSWAEIPARFEAGSPNLAGAAGLASAIDYLNGIGIGAIERQVRDLTGLALNALAGIEGVTLYGPEQGSNRAGIVSFKIDGIHPHDIAQIGGEQGVAIRAGHHCCQPLMQRFGVSSTARASLHFYNNEQDIVAFEHAIRETIRIFGPR